MDPVPGLGWDSGLSCGDAGMELFLDSQVVVGLVFVVVRSHVRVLDGRDG